MKTGTKIVIGVVITIVLIIGLVVGALTGLFFYADYKIQKRGEKENQASVDGREFGRTTNQNGCIEKGFTLKREIDKFDSVTINFVRECLESSEPILNFCVGIPDYHHQSNWNDKQCEKVPNNAPCHDTIYAKQSYCADTPGRDQANLDGREFGKTTDHNGCMEKGFTLTNDIIRKWTFTEGCLRTSRPTPDFCQGVPYHTPEWADEQCKNVGDNKVSCGQAFYGKQIFCRSERGK